MSHVIQTGLPFMLAALVTSTIVLSWRDQPRRAQVAAYLLASAALVFVCLQFLLAFLERSKPSTDYATGDGEVLYLNVLGLMAGAVLLLVWMVCLWLPDSQEGNGSQPYSRD